MVQLSAQRDKVVDDLARVDGELAYGRTQQQVLERRIDQLGLARSRDEEEVTRLKAELAQSAAPALQALATTLQKKQRDLASKQRRLTDAESDLRQLLSANDALGQRRVELLTLDADLQLKIDRKTVELRRDRNTATLHALRHRRRVLSRLRDFIAVAALLVLTVAATLIVSEAIDLRTFFVLVLVAAGALVSAYATRGSLISSVLYALWLYVRSFRGAEGVIFEQDTDAQLSMALADIETEIQDLDIENDLIFYSADPENQRAVKLFRVHQQDTKSYYDSILSQNKDVAFVGLFCIAAGFAFVGATIYLVGFQLSDTRAQIVVGSLGAIGSIMANFIGSIYLSMFSGTLQALTTFHERLVETQHLHFRALLVNRIGSAEMRDATLSDIAKEATEPPGLKPVAAESLPAAAP
jgi:hypothetical protein